MLAAGGLDSPRHIAGLRAHDQAAPLDGQAHPRARVDVGLGDQHPSHGPLVGVAEPQLKPVQADAADAPPGHDKGQTQQKYNQS